MTHRIAYYRVSSGDQSIEAQRAAMAGGAAFDAEYSDEGVSGLVMAVERPGFADLLKAVRALRDLEPSPWRTAARSS